MLPAPFQIPTAILILAGGLLSCFFGYRLFRLVLVFWGFILGALIGSSAMGPGETWQMLLAAVIGGVVGALILFAAYFVGVALVGASIGALIVHVVSANLGVEPHLAVVIVVSIVGAIAALSVQRFVIIFGTAFGGAWSVIVGGLAVAGDRTAAVAATTGDVWVFYPTTLPPGQRWLILAWIVLGVVGCVTQLQWTGKKKGQ